MNTKTHGSTGWLFKLNKSRSGVPAKFRANRVRVPGSTDTPRARHNVQERVVHVDETHIEIRKDGSIVHLDDGGVYYGLGSSVLYRDHVKGSTGIYDFELILDVLKIPRNRRYADGRFVEEWHQYSVVTSTNYTLHCIFSGNRAFFVERDAVLSIVRVSCEFTTDRARKLARESDPRKKILWLKKIQLPDPPVVDTP